MNTLKRAPRELSPEKTEAILDGAMQEFLTHGYAATSMDRVAAAAGVSKATVYNHFQGKEDLFKALIRRLAQRKELFAQEALQSSSGDPVVSLKRYAHSMMANLGADPQVLTFIRIVIGESGRFPELARTFVEYVERPTLKRLTTYLAEHPDLDLPDPEVAARTFTGAMVHFIIMRDILHGGDIVPMEFDRLLDNLLPLMLKVRAQR
ncbi:MULTISPECIES: TetR/AcrR family transcriptional regulator [unclassified Leptolyngbya]|uniref:TetR/AcrR family transcriptional regulator n=1 Tax=unclassified Leptolyngbya TaxID=2650499 RepID=UPI0016845A82|nr:MULTISPECIES: TetR/AcrR family transcriptional regulator [unclassified Leptolyngbya]MBD1909954.1 TetR/AcrR family transcriptional regulator [Leptolyngbya sp. FACHB-8]MBD2159059.1 TetR/AcrR family transcriptional regulator [Leptolyngbya sp. FACHB-16]